MMRRLTIGLVLAGLLGALAGGAAMASTITYIDAPGAYVTTCGGGVVGVVFGSENDVTVECAWSDPEQVLCGLPGVVDWQPAGDQVVVTCEAPK